MGAFDFRSPAFGFDYIRDGGVADGMPIQRTKIGFGIDDAYGDVSAANPLPVGGGNLYTVSGAITSADTVYGAYLAPVVATPPVGSYLTIVLKGNETFVWALIPFTSSNTSGAVYTEVSLNTTDGINGTWINSRVYGTNNNGDEVIQSGDQVTGVYGIYNPGFFAVMVSGFKGVRFRYAGASATVPSPNTITAVASNLPAPFNMVGIDSSQIVKVQLAGTPNVFDQASSDATIAPGSGSNPCTLGTNLLLASGSGPTYIQPAFGTQSSMRSIATSHIPSAGTITAGAVLFEQQIDTGSSSWYPLFLFDDDAPGTPLVSGYTQAAGVARHFSGPLKAEAIRFRQSVALAGTCSGILNGGVLSPSVYVPKYAIPPAITKGTQAANGITTQDLKDAGRSARQVFLDTFAVAATAETLLTLSVSADGATPTTGTSYNVTSAKRFRIQSLVLSLNTTTGNTTAVYVTVRLRVNATGAAVAGSPIQMVIVLPGIATANGGSAMTVPIPDGYELVGGAGLGITATCPGFVATTAAPKLSIALVGYEY